MSSKLALMPVGADEPWDELVSRSPQGTLFSERRYLRATGRRHDMFWIKQGEETKAGIALVVSDDGASCEFDDLVIYGGLLFDLDRSRPAVKRRYDEFQVSEFVIAELVPRYRSLDIAFAPQYEDMRPVLWYRYHDAESERFRVDLRYTSYVDLSSLPAFEGREEASPCFERMEKVRRYSVREARRKGGTVRRADTGDRLIEFYRAMMARQATPQPETKLARMHGVVGALVDAGRGGVFETLNADGIVIYVVCYGWDTKRAYYLFGAGHPDINEPWQGTVAHWEAFKTLASAHRITEVDLEGVNSPQRGWFKLGLGGDLRTYYQVSRMGDQHRGE